MIRERSRLSASTEEVWGWASTMSGVNGELMPLIRMTHPAEAESLSQLADEKNAGEAPGGLFSSWLLLGGVLPIDRHHLTLEQVYPSVGFDERSSSWLQREWVHRRRIKPLEQGCEVVDEVDATPRIGFLKPVVMWIVKRVFRHRHQRLRRRFGRESQGPGAGMTLLDKGTKEKKSLSETHEAPAR